jgi:hypothetical protein
MDSIAVSDWVAFGIGGLIFLALIAQIWLELVLIDFVFSLKDRVLRRLFHWW